MTEVTGTLYQRAGGAEPLLRIVARFYAGVATDPVLRPLYPEQLGPAEDRFGLFLVQWTGGPEQYTATRGHPKLRLRHLEFAIGEAERDAWVSQMTAAVRAEGLQPEVEAELLDALARTANFLVNRGGLAIGGSS
ncbi:MAG: globin [Acidimicrobiaceae bacterium]|nr:globin [Acidimicrobiaceae bacterium]